MSRTDLSWERDRNAGLVVSLSSANAKIAALESELAANAALLARQTELTGKVELEVMRLDRTLHALRGDYGELDSAFDDLETKLALLSQDKPEVLPVPVARELNKKKKGEK